jgi:hypothetical protein
MMYTQQARWINLWFVLVVATRADDINRRKRRAVYGMAACTH